MASDTRQPRRHVVLALGLTAALVGCSDPGTSETATTPSVVTGSRVVQDNATAPLEGLALEVHRDPG